MTLNKITDPCVKKNALSPHPKISGTNFPISVVSVPTYPGPRSLANFIEREKI